MVFHSEREKVNMRIVDSYEGGFNFHVYHRALLDTDDGFTGE